MKAHAYSGLVFLLLTSTILPTSPALDDRVPPARIALEERWLLQSSVHVQEPGEVVSTTGFEPQNWYTTSVPSTVLAALVANKVYPDPYFGMNLRAIPGTTYPIGANFSNLPMPPDSPFRVPWWYRTEFVLPADLTGKNLWLHFDGINYRANIWLNGRPIATRKEVAGTFRLYEFDVTGAARPGETNVLAVGVFPPAADDLAITWVDWNPAPPDKNMGLWREVYITASGPVALRHPQVITRLDWPSLRSAHLTVTVEARNASHQTVTGTLTGRIEGIQFSQDIQLAAQETRLVEFAPEHYPQLSLAHPRLWWPAGLGPQNLYDVNLAFTIGDEVSDRQAVRFGIREVTTELNERGHQIFQINGKKILIRGGGWASDMLLRFMPGRLEDEFKYVRDMRLNTIRLEGKLEADYFYDLADRYGILIMAGWCCCDHWEKWENWKEEDYEIAARSQESQIRRLRNHPSLLVWLNGSDNPPPQHVEETYIRILKALRWPNPYLSSATAKPAPLTGPTGVKMTGPYDWVPPSYWLMDTQRGGAHGFNTETSPGPAVPPVESLRQMLPEEHLWPIDEYWNFHAGGGVFKDLRIFTDALNARYGTARGLEDYTLKSQLMAYEGWRAMFEAYARNKYASTGVIQWMLNDAWPSLIWHLYDYYLRPGGAYFGAKKACALQHVQYSYDDQSIVVVNGTYQPLAKAKVSATVYNLDLTEKFSHQLTLDVPADSSVKAFVLPALSDLTPTYFLKLSLADSAGRLLSSNFYWLSAQPDVLDWERSMWYYTPTRAYADFTALESLPPAEVKVSSMFEPRGEEEVAHVTVENPSPQLAFAVVLRLTKGPGGDDVLPIRWQDNYFPLLPGERREITATYRVKDLEGSAPVVEVGGWNISTNAAPSPPQAKMRP